MKRGTEQRLVREVFEDTGVSMRVVRALGVERCDM